MMGNITFFNAFCVSMLHVVVTVSGDSTLGPGAQAPQILPRTPKFLVELIGSIVISLSRGCLPNDEGPGPQIFFSRTATGIFLQMAHAWILCINTIIHSDPVKY